ncbi:MAG: RQC domain-containing protein, partial [Myxococcota bacterium]|nr:RQC domain-containing protein [Myxococcota bacterium]
VEAYYQEVGRAGRDGERSRCVLLFTYADTRIHEFFISRAGDGLPPDEQAIVMARERRKLRGIVGYAYEEGCRHGAILRHFGERFVVGPEGCGVCDRCTGESGVPGLRAVDPSSAQPRGGGARSRSNTPKHAVRALEEAEIVIVQKVLSAVARSKGRLGAADLARVLRGSNRSEIVTDPLASSKSFGILAEMSHPTLTALVRALADAGCLQGRRPVLTPVGADVMWRRNTVALAMPPFEPKVRTARRSGTATRPPRELSRDQRDLLDALKEARREAAGERGVPAYRIASNKLLEALLDLGAGADKETWLAVSGVGPVNIDPLREVFEPVFEAQADQASCSGKSSEDPSPSKSADSWLMKSS